MGGADGAVPLAEHGRDLLVAQIRQQEVEEVPLALVQAALAGRQQRVPRSRAGARRLRARGRVFAVEVGSERIDVVAPRAVRVVDDVAGDREEPAAEGVAVTAVAQRSRRPAETRFASRPRRPRGPPAAAARRRNPADVAPVEERHRRRVALLRPGDEHAIARLRLRRGPDSASRGGGCAPEPLRPLLGQDGVFTRQGRHRAGSVTRGPERSGSVTACSISKQTRRAPRPPRRSPSPCSSGGRGSGGLGGRYRPPTAPAPPSAGGRRPRSRGSNASSVPIGPRMKT